METIKEYLKYGSAVIAIITFLITFFNKEHLRYDKNREKYFDNLLLKFYSEYRKHNNMNVKKFFDKNYSYSDIYIPSYINYLIEKKEYIKLKKVLIVDYFRYCPLVKNSISNIFYKFFNRLWFIEYFIIYLSIMFTFVLFIILIPNMIEGVITRLTKSNSLGAGNTPSYRYIGLGLILVWGYLQKINIQLSWVNKDMYTYDEKYIKKIIKLRENKYEKLKKKIYFLKS